MSDPLAYLSDPNDPRVVEALTRVCTVCGAAVGAWCANPGPRPVLNRLVHLSRVQHEMDGRSR